MKIVRLTLLSTGSRSSEVWCWVSEIIYTEHQQACCVMISTKLKRNTSASICAINQCRHCVIDNALLQTRRLIFKILYQMKSNRTFIYSAPENVIHRGASYM